MSDNIYISGKSSNNRITISSRETNNNLNTQNNNAKYYSDKALEGAEKAKQSAEEAKQSAQVAQASASSILNDEGFIAVSQNLEPINTVANSIDDVSYVANNAEKIEQIVEDLNNIGDTTNINIVATNIDTVNTTANNINSVNDVAESINSVNEIAYNLTEVLNSKIYSENAKESETRALNYADNASISSDLAQQWAVSSSLVENTDYSSKHYANQAKSSATTATNQATIATNKANEAINTVSNTLNKTQISNCLLEVPQRINLELNDGVLTLKAGSELIFPDGFEADGTTPKFTYKTIADDITVGTISTTAAQRFLGFNSANGRWDSTVEYTYSGNTVKMNSETPQTFKKFYNTETNEMYSGNGTAWVKQPYSLPVCLITNDSTGTITSIDQVFNGFGYIGSTVWVDKGVKGLIPKGRNADGTLKNQEVTISKVSTRTINSGSSKNQGIVLYGSDITWRNYYVQEEIPSVVARWYNPKTNYMYVNNSSDVSAVQLDNSFLVGYINCTNGKIDNIQINEPFRSTNYNDFQELKNNVETLENSIIDTMYPDYTTYEQKTENTLYQAEEDGWVLIVCSNSNQNSNADLYIGPTQDNLIKVLENGSNVVSHCGAPYPIKKGWYYKAIDEGGYSAIEFGFVSNFK